MKKKQSVATSMSRCVLMRSHTNEELSGVTRLAKEKREKKTL